MPTTQAVTARTKPRKRAEPTPEALSGPPAELLQLPLSRLVPSPLNVRKTPSGSLDGLAASILAHGLLQNLNVAPETGPPQLFMLPLAASQRPG